MDSIHFQFTKGCGLSLSRLIFVRLIFGLVGYILEANLGCMWIRTQVYTVEPLNKDTFGTSCFCPM